uniref:Urocortin 2 n=1 Tax=Prolemur simus TaxID=1328070 RepID=A0A8C9ASI9_PROSS
MTRWALLVLMVLMLGRVLVVPATPVPVFQLLTQNYPQTTLWPVASESPSATRGQPSLGPRPGPRITLSLDVPIGLLQILLEQARASVARERAATNARILAHVGRR